MLYAAFFMSVLGLGLCLPWDGNIRKEREECRCSQIEHILMQNEHLQKQNEELWSAVGMLEKHIKTIDHWIEGITTNPQR